MDETRITVFDLQGRAIGTVLPADMKPPKPAPRPWSRWTYALLEGDEAVALPPEPGWPTGVDWRSAG